MDDLKADWPTGGSTSEGHVEGAGGRIKTRLERDFRKCIEGMRGALKECRPHLSHGISFLALGYPKNFESLWGLQLFSSLYFFARVKLSSGEPPQETRLESDGCLWICRGSCTPVQCVNSALLVRANPPQRRHYISTPMLVVPSLLTADLGSGLLGDDSTDWNEGR